jgi:cytidine kinase
MPDYVAYGKIHIDNIKQVASTESYLGGGGPQAIFGMRLWSDSVGFMTRSGTDIPERIVAQLRDLGADLSGWKIFSDLPTPQTNLVYDENEYLVKAGIENYEAWHTMMRTPIPLPKSYREAKVLHLVTEWSDIQIVQDALALRDQGTIFSLEPIIDYKNGTNHEDILALLPNVDVVTPDFPSARGIANSDDPKAILTHWSKLGPKLVAIRDGARGSYVWSANENALWHMPPIPIEEVVDPTGAGNAFGGGLCVGWAKTKDARTAAAYGTIAAYMMLQVLGLPAITEEQVQEAHALLQSTIASAKWL